MRKTTILFTLFILTAKLATSQIVTHSTGKIEIPNVTSNDGPLGAGSLLWFSSGDASTAIQENWGLNLIGDNLRPVKIYNTSLLIGYTSANQDFGTNNAYINGNVGIGTTDTKGYSLAINGKAIATAFYVKSYANWPDYVFQSGYKLPSLNDVKNYITQNHHLPDRPSAAEVNKSGIDLGETNKILTKKVEELTLYLIEKDQQLNQQKQDITNQQQQLDAQAKLIARLVAAIEKITPVK